MGKTSALAALARLGHATIDTDEGDWTYWATLPDGSREQLWREDAMTELLSSQRDGHLFVAGCVMNHGRFYKLFDRVVLMSAPADVILARVFARDNNPYGKDPTERHAILADLRDVEPLLRRSATDEIVTTIPLEEVVARLEEIAADAAV